MEYVGRRVTLEKRSEVLVESKMSLSEDQKGKGTFVPRFRSDDVSS